MERALERALADWRLVPSDELADHIDELSDRLTYLQPALSPAQFFAAAKAPKAAELGQVLASLPAFDDPSLPARLELLHRWPRDPRIASAIERLLCQAVPPARARSLWSRLLALVAAVGDRRAARWLADVSVLVDGSPWAVRRLGVRINQLCADLERASPAVRGPLRRCLEPLVPPAELRAVFEPPDALQARLVWADQLSSLGDVRGEAIVLGALTHPRRPQRRRLKELERDYGRAWLGRLSPAFKPEGLKFRDGAVVAGRLSFTRQLYRLAGLPEWGTVEELDLREASRWLGADWRLLARLLAASSMRRLTRLHSVPYLAVVALLKQHRPLLLTHCEVQVEWRGPRGAELARDLAASGVFGALRTLRVGNELHPLEPQRRQLARRDLIQTPEPHRLA